MAKLFDKLMVSNLRGIREKLRGAEVVDAQNVSEYLNEIKTLSTSDLPNCAPPFERCFIEFPVKRVDARGRLGVLVDAVEARYLNWPEFEEADGGWLLFLELYSDVCDLGKDGTGILIADGQGAIKTDGTVMFYRNENGNESLTKFTPAPLIAEFLKTEEVFELASEFEMASVRALTTFCFMNCSNVTVDTNYPPKPLVKKNLRRHGVGLCRFRTLRIDGLKKQLNGVGRAHEDGLAHALHVCRGHFKNYNDKPLFGRITGTYWWRPQLRGDAKQGAVVKEYCVG